ncbi:hypothetical protein [Oscillibacter sp. GMB15532]|uniref:hypothetical protein n=1 Tax=Oscillibacter sp. GMB15532 TaxID=3230022 RepID=UPI0034DE1554
MDELTAILEELKKNLQPFLDEEDEALGNLPESFQEGERGSKCRSTSTSWKRPFTVSERWMQKTSTRRSKKLLKDDTNGLVYKAYGETG